MRHPGRMNRDGYPARVLDILETDAGWLTEGGITAALPVKPGEGTVKTVLLRLERRGLVERRVVQLASQGAPAPGVYGSSYASRVEQRIEWRFKTWGEWTA